MKIEEKIEKYLNEGIHPSTQELLRYPNTKGKNMAMDHYKWDKLTKEEEANLAPEILKMAKRFDGK